ncbi:probable small intestine urate exporter [Pteropus vampyrus]|uniref:Probable small intestine urate exporter n=1 Tax=Pteropus vampyrus TaxID=132908 RepID=A0A6P6CT46_PTEVA|nr:probable small intestine urate exporter [Pteropus vampyrus]
MNLSIALPAMVNVTVLPGASPDGPPADAQDSSNDTAKEPEALAPAYDWSPEAQGFLLSALSVGSFLASIPSGFVVGACGVKYPVGVAMLASSVLNLFVPLAADAGVASLFALRTVQGVAQVVVSVGQYAAWVKWAPALEKNQLVAIAASGLMLGTLTIFLAGGFLCQTLGWPSVFYVFGGVGCACSCLWFPLVYDDPADHPFIGTGERDHIMRSRAQQDSAADWSLPVKAMSTSLPLWGILVFYFSEYWFVYMKFAYMPTYLSSVLGLSLTNSGFLLALLLAASFASTVLGGLLADFLLSREVLRLVVIRKLLTAAGVLFPAASFACLHWARSSLGVTVALLVVCSVTNSLCLIGALINFLDIAPRYVSPPPPPSPSTLAQDAELGWRNTFLLSAAISVAGLLAYLVLGRAEVQDWARDETPTRL